MGSDDYFSLFNLPSRFLIDPEALERSWRLVASQVHPDRFATASPAERRVAMQWAARVNVAYQQLRDPMLRARYLCEQAGVDLETESNTAMAPAFLMQQIEWWEMLDDARHDPKRRTQLEAELKHARDTMQRTLVQLLDERKDYKQAGAKVREWMFVEKLVKELSHIQPQT